LLRPTTAKVASVPFLAMRGSGYIRGRVCQAQSDPGCAIVSISRMGIPNTAVTPSTSTASSA